MKVQSFENLLLEYGITQLEPDDLIHRNEMLLTYKYSVILEGEFIKLDNLQKWVAINSGKGVGHNLFYAKIGYDYGFADYFFVDEQQALNVSRAIPHIYT